MVEEWKWWWQEVEVVEVGLELDDCKEISSAVALVRSSFAAALLRDKPALQLAPRCSDAIALRGAASGDDARKSTSIGGKGFFTRAVDEVFFFESAVNRSPLFSSFLFVSVFLFSLSHLPFVTMARMGRVGGKGKGKGKYVVVHHDRSDDGSGDEDERGGGGGEEEQPAGGDRYPSEENEAGAGAAAPAADADAGADADAEAAAGTSAPAAEVSGEREREGERERK